MICYLMWWKSRPVRDTSKLMGSPLRDAPWWGIAAAGAAALLIRFWLPLVGRTLLAFLVLGIAIARRRLSTR